MKNLPINFEQPIWLLLPVLLAAIAISAFLYYRKNNQGFPKSLNVFLFLLRASALFLLGLLLLNPYFINKTKILEKPKVVVAIDVSESMLNSGDSTLLAQNIQKNINQIEEDLSQQFDLDILTFDRSIYHNKNISFDGKRTDIGHLLKYVNDKYYMLNLSAVILMTDGQNNQGLSPEYTVQGQSTEIYPIIYGDTVPSTDLLLSKLFYNKIIRQGGKFPLEIIVQANGLVDEQVEVQIEYKGKIIQSQSILVTKDSFTKELKFDIETKGKGLQAYTIRLKTNKQEKNKTNNSSRIYVQVIESGNRVLVLGNAPHPDLGAIASALRTSDGYSVDIKTLNDYPFKTDDYQLIIMHGLPSVDARSNKIFLEESLKNKAIWYVLSTSTDINKINEQDLAWELSVSNGVYEHVEATYKDDFTSFQWPQKYKNSMDFFPPLYAPFSSFKNNKKSDIMFWQSMRGFQSDKPLLAFWSKGLRKYGLLSGEGLWKWRIYNYRSFGNHDIFNAFITRVSRYLLTGVYDDHFNIMYKNVYHETDLIEWEAQVYNQAFEPIPEAEISLKITDSEGHDYPYQFSNEGSSYRLNLDYFKPGEYSFHATAKTKDTIYYEQGNFVVNAWNMEQSKLGANTELLNRLANTTNGKVFYPSEISELNKYLIERPDFKPRSSYTQKLLNLIDMEWLAIIIILLLGIEWILRKRNGSY